VTPPDRALDPWREALLRQAPDPVRAALAADVTIWIKLPGRAPTALFGVQAAADWIARTPASLRFSIRRETISPVDEGSDVSVRHRVEGAGFLQRRTVVAGARFI
jgi:hypothetical protein